jgi:hypothetical protein
MKKFTFALIIIAFGFSFQAHALKQCKPTSLKSPADHSVASGYATDFSYYITNTGDEAILATDSIFVDWGQVSGSSVAWQPMKFLFKTGGLAVGDSFAQTFNVKITGTSGGTFGLGFLAGIHLHQLWAVAWAFNLNVGINEQAKAINKVWFSNNTLNYELIPKSTCKANLSILNLNGQIVKDQSLNLTEGNSVNETISLGNLPKGMYLLRVQTQFGIDTKKFMVQ